LRTAFVFEEGFREAGFGVLKRAERLRKSKDFRITYRSGRAFSGRLLRLYVLRGGKGRLTGVVASKRTGGAVARNRFRRLVREAVRGMYPLLPDGIRLVFVAGRGACGASFTDVRAEVCRLLERAGVLSGGGGVD
jgi:ribonuclease P protein component